MRRSPGHLSAPPTGAALGIPTTMTNVFAVVGQHRENPDRLLLLGEDGHHYACDVTDAFTRDGPPVPVEATDEWLVDAGAEIDAAW